MKRAIIIFSLLVYLSSFENASAQLSMDNNGCKIRQGMLKTGEYQSPADAGNPWQSIGPYGGDVVDIAIDPVSTDTLYAAAGIPYFSGDGGASWSILDPLFALANSGISSIEISNSGAIFAGGQYIFGKIYRSLDNGSTWQQSVFPVNSTVLDIATDPSNDQVVYCALSSLMGSAFNKVIMKSENNGQNWTALDLTSVLPVGYSAEEVAVDPDNSQTIFVIGHEGFSNCVVVASFDGGSTWEVRNTGLPSGKPYNAITLVDNTAYLAGGQLFGGQNVGVYKSTDFGLSWQNISASFPNKVTNEIVYSPFDHNYLYAGSEGDGVYFSSDGGATWIYNTQGDGDKAAVRRIVVDPDDPMKIYCGMLSLAIGKSSNGGSSWAFSNFGIATLLLNMAEVDVNSPLTCLASFEAENSGGCFITNDGGGSWQLAEGLPGTRYSAVEIGTDGNMYAWSNGPSTVAQEGLYKSTDGGVNWTNMGPNIGSLFETEVFSVCVSSSNPEIIFIGGNNFGANGWESVIYKTTDGGTNWDNVYKGAAYDGFRYVHIVSGANDQVVYAAFKSQDSQGGFLKSTDGGDTWDLINSGLPANCKWGGAIIAMPGEPDKVVGGVGGYGDFNGTVYLSIDGGQHWTATALSLGNYSRINDLVINPVSDSVIYAASMQDGVYISMDAGNTWEPSSDGLPAVSVSSFSKPYMVEGVMKFICSTTTNSAFISEMVSTGFTDIDKVHTKNTIFTTGPVPSKDFLDILVFVDKPSSYQIELFNTAGRSEGVLVSGNLSGGDERFRVPLPLLAPGVYIVEFISSEKVYRNKIVISD